MSPEARHALVQSNSDSTLPWSVIAVVVVCFVVFAVVVWLWEEHTIRAARRARDFERKVEAFERRGPMTRTTRPAGGAGGVRRFELVDLDAFEDGWPPRRSGAVR